VDKQKALIKVVIIASALLIYISLSVKFLLAEDTSSFPASIHIQSTFSDGKFTIGKIVEEAKNKGIKILIITDTILRRWEYGIRPFENIIKRTVEEDSVIQHGIATYLETIEEIQRKNPDIVLIAGVEVVPFYYWRANILKGDFILHDWHKQLLVIGLETIDAYKNLPVVGNRSFALAHRKNFIQLWPILVIIAGFFLLGFKNKRVFLFKGRIEFKPFKNLGYIFICFGTLLLFNNIPFSTARYNQYGTDAGIGPYQDLIDYVNQSNGMVFWAHPEASLSLRIANISVITRPYKYALWRARNYTGFASLYHDTITITKPGDLWDQILLHYCQGERNRPVWGFGEIDYDGNTPKNLDGIQTIFLLKDLNKKEVIKALRDGRFYAKLNNKRNDFFLTEFIVTDANNKITAGMGDEISLRGKPKVLIKANCSYPAQKKIDLRLIRNGETIKTFVFKEEPYLVEFQDDYYKEDKKIFYRLEIKTDFCQIISNPIFVKFSKN